VQLKNNSRGSASVWRTSGHAMTQTIDHQPVPDLAPQESQSELLEKQLGTDIKRLNRFSSRGLWAFSLFILVSLTAWRDFPMLPLPDKVVAVLGPPPSPSIISIVLLFYTFSAIILSLSRMTAGLEHKSSFCHVGYLTCFFLFYHFAKALDDNFWPVFGAGVTILAVESYRIWSFCRDALAIKTEQLEFVKRTGRLPPEED
jgi:hypothetical protein